MIIKITEWDNDYHRPIRDWTEVVKDEYTAARKIEKLNRAPGYFYWYKVVKCHN